MINHQFQDLERIFSLRNKTVLISFGSIVQSHALPLEVKHNILKVIRSGLTVSLVTSISDCQLHYELGLPKALIYFRQLHASRRSRSCGSMSGQKTRLPRWAIITMIGKAVKWLNGWHREDCGLDKTLKHFELPILQLVVSLNFSDNMINYTLAVRACIHSQPANPQMDSTKRYSCW